MRPGGLASKVVLVHTYYQKAGGEDVVFDVERSLLEKRGHVVVSYVLHNKLLGSEPPWRQAWLAVWNEGAYRKLRSVIQRERPQVVHIHNTFPLASPAVVHAAKAEGVPVVMTLHNYRLLCVNAL
ncbi:MAG: glycosyltransferase, partial [Candidatus Hadarchaeum sp.]